jgi:hypothetical protein
LTAGTTRHTAKAVCRLPPRRSHDYFLNSERH